MAREREAAEHGAAFWKRSLGAPTDRGPARLAGPDRSWRNGRRGRGDFLDSCLREQDAGPALKRFKYDPYFGNQRSHAYDTLVEIGRPAVALLVEKLATDSLYMRWLAVKALGWIGPDARAALPALQGAYENRRRGARHSWTDAIPEAIAGIN